MAIHQVAVIELGDDRTPDDTTIPNFRRLPERHGLTKSMFADVNALLADKGITLRARILVDANIIDAPPPATNKSGPRDPEMSSTKKANDCMAG